MQANNKNNPAQELPELDRRYGAIGISAVAAAVRYQSELGANCVNLKALGIEPDEDTLRKISDLAKCLLVSVAELETAMSEVPRGDSLTEARHDCYVVLHAMELVRRYADELEGFVADDLWPLPTYQEMLFIK